MFKWREVMRHDEISSYMETIWDRFLHTNRYSIKSIVDNLLQPKYTKKESSTHIHNRHDTVIFCHAICERLLYPGDRIVTINGNKNGYIVISACGSIITKSGDEYVFEKYGAQQYADEIIKIIKAVNKDLSVETWEKILFELDVLQTNIILVNTIKKLLVRT
jgi:hypothetical protein